jgi:hypothetical protein
MRANLIQRFPRPHIRSAQRLRLQRGISCACARTPFSRHLRWALEITERLGHRTTWRGIRPEGMTLSLGAPFWILLRHISMGRLYSTVSALPPRTRERDESTVRRLTSAPDGKLQVLSSEKAAQEPPRAATNVLNWVQNRIHTFSATLLSQESCTIKRTERFTVSEFLSAMSERPFSPQRIRLTHPPSVDAKTEMDIPARVQRRHRRVEQKSFLASRDLDPLPSIRLAEHLPVVEKSRPRLPARAEESDFEAKPRGRASRTEPPVNIGQITDAVLQQLDRRLVSARERMGRI